MGYISKCEHGTPMALCRKCFPDVSEHNDWSKYKYTHPVKELTDEEIWEVVSLKWWDWEDSFDVTGFARAILRKAQEK